MAVWEVKWLEGSGSKTKSHMYCTKRFDVPKTDIHGKGTLVLHVLPFVRELYEDGCLVKHIVHLTKGKMPI